MVTDQGVVVAAGVTPVQEGLPCQGTHFGIGSTTPIGIPRVIIQATVMGQPA